MSPFQIALVVTGAIILTAILTALFCYLSNRWLKVTRYEIKRGGAEGGDLKIVHLSDLHAARFGKDNSRLIKKVRAQSPDFIVVTGDIIHKYRPRDIAVANRTVNLLKDVAPVYYVSGNHEMRSTRWRALKAGLTESGAIVLDNRSERVCGVSLCGINCADLKNAKPFEVAKEAQGYKILLAHKPEFIQRYAMAGYDLALCGHAHGGQWRLPFTGIGFYSPGQGLFPKYTSGVHSCGDMSEVISRGLGNSECPLRIFNRPEIVVIDLIKS